MPKNAIAVSDHGPILVPAIELLLKQGYSATSVDELADAAGISRSTFFRKFGSKEDMIFADHERTLAKVADDLANTTGDPLLAVSNAVSSVFNQHVRHRETTLLRHRLLQQVPILRDRELVMTHRYERLFRQHLLAFLPESESREYLAVAFAAAVVAVHNRILRRWLRDSGDPAADRLDNATATQLQGELRALIQIFGPALLPKAVTQVDAPTVVVTVLEPRASTEQIVEAVRNSLA
jgi:AcrR family transcriptional regulator